MKSEFYVVKEKSRIPSPPSCFDDIIVSVANMYQCPYEAFYSLRWDFIFDKNSTGPWEEKVLGTKETNSKEVYQRIFDIQGFSLESVKKYQELSELKKLLKDNKVLIAIMDGFHVPWDAYYHTTHNSHAILIQKSDEDANQIVFYDTYYDKNGIDLDFETFYQGVKKILRPIVKKSTATMEDRLAYFRECVDKMNPHMFNDIAELADCILDTDIKNLFLSINYIAWNRWTYSVYLKSLETLDAKFGDYAEEMGKIADLWTMIKLSLIKCEALSKIDVTKFNNLRLSISQYLKRTAEREKILYQLILNKDTYKEVHKICLDTKRSGEINIKQLYNNKGISNKISAEYSADLSSLGEYIVIEGDNRDIFIGNGKQYDNVGCIGQTIELEKECYIDHLIFVGCCEWGSYSDYITLNQTDSSCKQIPLELSDFSVEPMYGETAYVEGVAYNNNQGTLTKTWDKVCIYQKEIEVKHAVKTITLPVCPNMHIMKLFYN